jgi:hypothetical protein
MQDTYRITKQLTNHFTTIPLLELNDKFAVLQQEKVDLCSDAKQDILQAHLSLDSSKATGIPHFSELSQSITNPPLIMSIETLNFKTRMEDGK